MSQPTPGLSGQSSKLVETADLASAYGNPGADVLSSMTLMTLLEGSCLAALEGHLDQGQMTVGARMEMDHMAPTPPGLTVTATAELSEVKGPKLVFSVSAHDGVEQVAKAVHVRYVVDKDRFFKGVEQKVAKRS
ncbi:MAG: thioesterase [Deltaproteobacteria bacterium]|nr:thioesterase [Deltaproteobacteria bacterium]